MLSNADNEITLLMELGHTYECQQRALMQRLLSGDIPDLDPAA